MTENNKTCTCHIRGKTLHLKWRGFCKVLQIHGYLWDCQKVTTLIPSGKMQRTHSCKFNEPFSQLLIPKPDKKKLNYSAVSVSTCPAAKNICSKKNKTSPPFLLIWNFPLTAIFLNKKPPPRKKTKKNTSKLGSSGCFSRLSPLSLHTSGAEGMPRQSASLAAFRGRGGVGSDPKKTHKGVEKKNTG